MPLELQARYAAWADSGTLTRQLTVINRGTNALHVEALPSLAWTLPAGNYELTTLQGIWDQERQVVVEKLAAAPKSFESPWGRSTSRMSPWLALRHEPSGWLYLAQLAWSGNWNLSLERSPAAGPPGALDLRVALGIRFDRGGAARVPPGGRLELPLVAFTCTTGDLDDAANALHRFQRQFVVPNNPANTPPLVQFNSWYPFPGKMNIADMKRCVDRAAELGAEVFVLDAGWYNKKDWFRETGDWYPDRKAFPNGTAELAQYAHRQGLKFGLWVEIEVFGELSDAFKQHPEWCLKREGRPILKDGHYHLDFGKPAVRAWAKKEMDRLVREHRLDWVKIDYNNDVGEALERDDGTSPGTVLYQHVRGYYDWLDAVRAAHPRLIIENCSSGGLRFDLGILGHTHTTWISDRTLPRPSVQLAYGATLEFTPQVCNHWMVGDEENGTVNAAGPPGWWDFMLRVPMNGQYGISSKIFDWPPALTRCTKDNIALYKRVRPVIAYGDCYHLTPPPAHQDPTGWTALQYVAADRSKSVVMVYRLGQSSSPQTFTLHGLEPNRTYRVRRDGAAAGTLQTDPSARATCCADLPEEWRAAILELEAVR